MNMKSLLELLNPYRTISIIGMGKNVGKTTTLNYLINGFGKRNLKLMLTSIGRDGEDIDVVTHTEKPPIFVTTNTIVITTERLLSLCDITAEILMVTDITTPLGRVIVLRSLSAGFVHLSGPSITTQMADLLKSLQEIDADKIIIDGAISRKSSGNPTLAQSAILCSGATLFSNMDDVIEKTRHEVQMLLLPSHKEEREDDIFLQGAVSDTKIREIVLSGKDISGTQIVIDDATKIFITTSTYEKLLIKRAKLVVKTPINLIGVTLNPVSPRGFSFDRKQFLSKMQDVLPVPVYDVVGGY